MALLRVEDLEQDSRISRYTWRAWIRQGRLPVIRAGRRVRVEEAEYRAFLNACRVPARPTQPPVQLESRAVTAQGVSDAPCDVSLKPSTDR